MAIIVKDRRISRGDDRSASTRIMTPRTLWRGFGLAASMSFVAPALGALAVATGLVLAYMGQGQGAVSGQR